MSADHRRPVRPRTPGSTSTWSCCARTRRPVATPWPTASRGPRAGRRAVRAPLKAAISLLGAAAQGLGALLACAEGEPMTPRWRPSSTRPARSWAGSCPAWAARWCCWSRACWPAWLLARLVRKLLDRAGLDALVDRVGTGRVLAKAGLGSSLTRLLATAVRVAITAVAIFAALSLLGLQFLSESLNQAVLFLPKLAVAAALLLAGAVVGALVGERLDRLRARDGPGAADRPDRPGHRVRGVRHHRRRAGGGIHGAADGAGGHPARRAPRPPSPWPSGWAASTWPASSAPAATSGTSTARARRSASTPYAARSCGSRAPRWCCAPRRARPCGCPTTALLSARVTLHDEPGPAA